MAINPSVEKALSTKRLDAYRQHSSTEDGAWALYRWNTEVSAAVLPMAADLEVTLRNAIHELMADRFEREDWWASPTLLFDDVTNQMLTDVVRKHQKKLASGTVGPGRVIADTTLGVWIHLLSRGGHSALGRSVDYETRLWRPTFRFGFSTGTRTPSGRERRPARSEVHRRASCSNGFEIGPFITNRSSRVSSFQERTDSCRSMRCGNRASNCSSGCAQTWPRCTAKLTDSLQPWTVDLPPEQRSSARLRIGRLAV